MDINQACRLVELEKEGRKFTVILWEGDKITSCATAQDKSSYCETCQGDNELCDSYIKYLKEKGYEATEIELGAGIEETLPKFLEEKERDIMEAVTPSAEMEEGGAEEEPGEVDIEEPTLSP